MSLSATICFLAGATLPSLLIAWGCGFVVRRAAPRWGLVDHPGRRKAHSRPTPLGGGLAIWAAVVAVFLAIQISVWALAGSERTSWIPPIFAEHLAGMAAKLPAIWCLLAAGTVLMVLGLYDDRRGIDWRIRLAVQTAVAAVCAWLLPEIRLTLFVDLPLVTGVISVAWMVGLVNSFNMLDNMDGLSAGVAAISAGMLAVVMLISPNPEGSGPQLFVAGLLLVLMGSALGFLGHNRSPARLFMGDAGSYFLGFMLAVATLLATFAAHDSTTQHAILAPLCVMAVPLYDTLTVVWIRLREGRSPFHADRCHFSHRLVELGMSPRQAVWTIYLVTVTCGLAAILLHQVGRAGAVVLVLVVIAALALIAILEAAARRKIREE